MSFTDYKLKFLIEADSKSAKQELDKLQGSFSSTFAGAVPGITAAAGAVASVGTAVAGAGLALFNLTKTAADFGSEIYDASQKTGLSATALSAMKAAAEQSGSSLEAVTKGIAKFAKQYEGTGTDLRAELGKTFKQINEASSGFEQLSLAQKKFGKSGADLLPFIKSFDGDLDGLIATMEDLGVTIDDKAAYQADQFGDQLDILEAQVAGLGRTIGSELMPVFTELSQNMGDFIRDNKDDIRDWGTATANVLRGVAAYWRDARDAMASYMGGRADTENRSGINGWSVLSSMHPLAALWDTLQKRGEQVPQQFGPYAWEMDPSRGKRTVDRDTSGGGGKKIRPPKESDAEFRKFFKELGFDIVRTFGKALNDGSPHTYGGAADISVRGKSASDIFTLMVKSLEKGYRVFDEQIPAPGVKQTGPHVHVENAKTTLAKQSRFTGKGLTADQVAYLRYLDNERLGKATGMAGFANFTEKTATDQKKVAEQELADAQQVLDEWIADLKQAMDERLSLRQAENKLAEEMLRQQLETGLMTEVEYIDRISEMRIDTLEDEKRELGEQISTRENIHRIQVLDLAIAEARLKKENDIAAALERQERSIREAGRSAGQKALGGLRDGVGGAGGGMFDGLDAATGKVRSFQDVMTGLGNAAADVFMQMGQGLGSMLQSWVLMGDQADVSMSKMVASVLAGVAAQAATLSIFHLAMGIVALTPWGAAMYGSPTNHFIASAIWGGIAAGAAVGGRLAAGDSFKGGSAGRAGSSMSAGSSGSVSGGSLTPYTRASSNAYYSGRDTHIVRLAVAIERFNDKVDSAKPGDVFIRGMKANRGAVGNQVAEDIRSNAATGTKIGRAIGIR